jgi:glutamate/aspartate transport system substrate-binding protein
MNRTLSGLFASIALSALLPALPATAQGAPDTLARIKAAKAINVAFSGDSPPYSFVDKENRPAGYSIDLCKRVIAKVGRAVGIPELKTNWLVGTVSERLQMVASGKADLECGNTTATQSRMKSVDFSSLIFVESGGFLVLAAGPVQKIGDLGGKKIGVLAGTTTETRLARMLQSRLLNAEVIKLKDGSEGVAMLESGSLDAFAGDKVKLVGLGSQAKDPNKLAVLGEDLSYEPLAFALPRGDSALRLEVNRALTQVYVSGEIEPIFRQWFGGLGRPSTLLEAMYILNAIPD